MGVSLKNAYSEPFSDGFQRKMEESWPLNKIAEKERIQ